MGGKPHLQDFINVLHDTFLYQHVHQPTRPRLGENSNILDLVFSKEEGLVSTIEHYPGLGKNDHECLVLVFNVICNKHLNANNSMGRNIFKANFPKIETFLEGVDWNSLLAGEISDAYKRFCEALDKAEGNIPVIKGNSKRKKDLFMTKDALRLRKNKHWNKYQITKSQRYRDKFKESRYKLRTTTRKLREQFEVQIITGLEICCI